MPHKQNKVHATFAHISTSSGKDIKLTPDHLILSGRCGSLSSAGSGALVRAADLQLKSCVKTVDGEEEVVTVNFVSGQEGIYTVVTNEEYLVVNGIVASPFAINHVIAHTFYELHRLVYSFTKSTRLLESAPITILNSVASYFAESFHNFVF